MDCYDSGIKWRTKSSLEPQPINNNYFVMDRRWEGEFYTKKLDVYHYFIKCFLDFPMYITLGHEKARYQQVGVINDYDFVVPFSLHSKQNAHVFICDPSVCIWLELQSKNDTNAVFRMCKNDYHKTVVTTNKCNILNKKEKVSISPI